MTTTEGSKYQNVSLTSPGEIVHLEYEPSELPAKPSADWTRFVCISDTHSHVFPVPDGDVLLHSGDLTNMGTLSDFAVTMQWLRSLPHKVKIIIAGNHDLTLHEDWYDTEWPRFHRRVGKQNIEPIKDLLSSVVYLQDSSHTFQVKENGRHWSVYGSPWSPEFGNWAFNYERDVADDLISKFPKTDILLTHGPPFEIFDRTNSGVDAGCEVLRSRLPELRPRLHLFGHIHEARGAYIHAWDPASDCEPPRIQAEPASIWEPDHLGDDAERTVFVNGANWPMGPSVARRRIREFAGPGFQPVVVDLKD